MPDAGRTMDSPSATPVAPATQMTDSSTGPCARMKRTRGNANPCWWVKASNPPSIKLCVGFHEELVAPMFRRPWQLEDEPSKADFIIESERWRCGKHLPVIVVDELKRFGLPFARILARQPADIAAATSALR